MTSEPLLSPAELELQLPFLSSPAAPQVGSSDKGLERTHEKKAISVIYDELHGFGSQAVRLNFPSISAYCPPGLGWGEHRAFMAAWLDVPVQEMNKGHFSPLLSARLLLPGSFCPFCSDT